MTKIHARNPPTPWGTEPPNVGFDSPRQGEISKVMLKMTNYGSTSH